MIATGSVLRCAALILPLMVGVMAMRGGGVSPAAWGPVSVAMPLILAAILCASPRRAVSTGWSSLGPAPLFFAAAMLWWGVQVLPWADRIALSHPAALAAGLWWLSLGTLGMAVGILAQVPKQAQWLAGGLLVIIAGQAVWGLILLIAERAWAPEAAHVGWARGGFANRNHFAQFTGMGAILGVGLWRQRRNAAPALIAALCGGAVLASGSRAGLACMLVGALCTLRPGWLVIRIGVALGAVVVCGAMMANGRMAEIATDISDRMTLYDAVLSAIGQNPWRGFGLGSFPIVIQNLHGPGLTGALVWDHAHNSYLTLAVEFGLIGCGIMALLLGAVLRRLVHQLRSHPQGGFAAIGVGVAVQSGLHAFVDFGLEIPAVSMLWVMLMALGLSGLREN